MNNMLWQFVPQVDYPVTEDKFPDISTAKLLQDLALMVSGIVVAEF